MNYAIAEKVVAITGGTAGIGRAVAARFWQEGCRVAVCGRGEERLQRMRAAFPERFLAVRADVSQPDGLETFARATVEAFGRIDIWVNNAGMSDPMPVLETDEAAFNRMVDLNLKSVFFGAAIAARQMRQSGGGVILNTSSFTSVVPTAGKALYGATKAAVDSLTRAMAAEFAADGIRVVSVIPGYIETEMTHANIQSNGAWLTANIAAGRLGTPEDLADAYVFLASEAAAYITGVALPVTGGKLCVQNCTWSWDRKKKEN